MTDRVDITRKAIAEMIGVIWQFHEEDKYELVDDESLIKKLDRKLLKLLNESKTGDWVAENLGEAITKILSRPGGFEIGRSPIFLRYQIKFKKQIYLYCRTMIADIYDPEWDSIEYSWVLEKKEDDD